MLFNRNLKRDKLFEQTNQSKYMNTVSTNYKTKTSNQQLNELTQYQLHLLNYKQSLTKDINHPRIRQLIMNHEKIESLVSTKSATNHAKENFKNNLINLQLLEERKWLTKKGKKYLIDFDDNERKQMKDCFNAMDVKKTGSIGVDELEELLISVGLMESREEVKQLIDSVDQDKSGKIQFTEFLKMILNDQGENQQIVQFFKFIINSKRTKNQQEIEWTKKSKSKPRSKSKDLELSPSNQKISLCQEKQNKYGSPYEKSFFHQNRNKFFSSPQNQKFPEHNKKNSALNIFEKHPHPKNLPFGMIVSHIRRKHMMTALKVNQQQTTPFRKNQSSNYSHDENRSNHYISSNILKSSQNMKDSRNSNNQNKPLCTDEDVMKGQSVMNALRKMWERRLLREIKERKSRKLQESKMAQLTETANESKKFLPGLM